MLAFLAALSIALSTTTTALDVPYVSQTPSLCGGAAAAMVFRYWGDSHANVEPFAALVDRSAGGIATNVLVDAIRGPQWEATPFTGSLASLRDQLSSDHPIILLLEDHPGTFHYVVAVGDDASGFVVHDPAWGPSRHLSLNDLEHRWSATNFWALLVLPTGVPLLEGTKPSPQNMHDVISPLSELAAVRFTERQWREAARLSQEALHEDPLNVYAWDVLGSSRFMLDDLHGALAAWNQIGKPKVDSVRVDGITRTRYQIVAESLGLDPGTLLTVKRFELAERRLEQLPDRSRARIGFVPSADGYALVDVAIAERAILPRNLGGFATMGADAAVNRQVTLALPGTGGQGQIWSANWRWWANRPKVAFEFSAPRVAFMPGVWRVSASWEAQSFLAAPGGAAVRENRFGMGLSVSNWLSHAWRYELSAGADSWDGEHRAASAGIMLERRGFQDRAVAVASVAHWMPLFASDSYNRGLLAGSFRSSADFKGFVYTADAHLESVSGSAPLSLWPGAGDGVARAPLLRAHPLLVNGIVTGPVFGRRVASVSNDLTYWIGRPKFAPIGIAAFVDAAAASQRMLNAEGRPSQVDAGLGLRLKIPGGMLRVDYAHGLNDGHDAATIGFSAFR